MDTTGVNFGEFLKKIFDIDVEVKFGPTFYFMEIKR